MTTKQDIISRIYGTTMHILHESSLYGSDLWPKNGFISGVGTEKTESDTIALRVSIGSNKELNVSWTSIVLNIINKEYKRAKEQARYLDLIMENATYDNILFENNQHPDLPINYRYRSMSWLNPTIYYCQLKFSFTIND